MHVTWRAGSSRWLSRRDGVRLDNGTAPPPLPLPEADVSDMEYFIEQAKIVLPVLGVNILRSPAPATGPTTASPAGGTVSMTATGSPVFELRVRKFNITATAQEVDGEFTSWKDRPPDLRGQARTTMTRHCTTGRDGLIIPGPEPDDPARYVVPYFIPYRVGGAVDQFDLKDAVHRLGEHNAVKRNPRSEVSSVGARWPNAIIKLGGCSPPRTPTRGMQHSNSYQHRN